MPVIRALAKLRRRAFPSGDWERVKRVSGRGNGESELFDDSKGIVLLKDYWSVSSRRLKFQVTIEENSERRVFRDFDNDRHDVSVSRNRLRLVRADLTPTGFAHRNGIPLRCGRHGADGVLGAGSR